MIALCKSILCGLAHTRGVSSNGKSVKWYTAVICETACICAVDEVLQPRINGLCI